ncbi:MAG: pilus assembly protein MshO, partial [Gammaproteobacteria bacterium]|nr:pilus assembly protein MshO [Gammaproteobacteria bacterium]
DNDSVAPADEHQILPLTGNFNFRWASPNQRVYIVDAPITYLCSPGANGTITRYRGYDIVDPQPTIPASFAGLGTTFALLTTPVSACSFTYTAGTNQRAGLVTLSITLTDNATNESVRLLYQVHVDNTP